MKIYILTHYSDYSLYEGYQGEEVFYYSSEEKLTADYQFMIDKTGKYAAESVELDMHSMPKLLWEEDFDDLEYHLNYDFGTDDEDEDDDNTFCDWMPKEHMEQWEEAIHCRNDLRDDYEAAYAIHDGMVEANEWLTHNTSNLESMLAEVDNQREHLKELMDKIPDSEYGGDTYNYYHSLMSELDAKVRELTKHLELPIDY